MKMKLIKIQCENCGANLEVNADLEKITCNYCGTEILLDDEVTKLKRIEEAKLKARKAHHEQLLKEKNDILEQEIKERKIKEELKDVENFKNNKLSKIILLCFVLAVLEFFVCDSIFIKILAFMQGSLFIVAWLMGMHIVKETFDGLKSLLFVLGILLIIPIINIDNMPKSENIVWDDLFLGEILPEPQGNRGHINVNSDTYLSLNVHHQSRADYEQYLDQCMKMGFGIEPERSENVFIAFNQDGYKLWTRYSDDSYTIHLDEPIKVVENAWINTALSKRLPTPQSARGRVDTDTSDRYVFYASDTSLNDFNEYVTCLKELGYDNNYFKSEKEFRAEDNSGYEVKVSYEGFNIMRIDISMIDD